MHQSEHARYQAPADEANELLALLIGALSLLDDFAAAVAEPSAAAHWDQQESHDPDDKLLAAALGLLSVRRTAWRWAHHAAGDHAAASRRMPATPAPAMSILR